MSAQRKISAQVQQQILFKSKRKCPICFVNGVTEPQQGDIAHINRDPSNNSLDNLVYLCLKHHAELDREDGLNVDDLKAARVALYDAVANEGAQPMSSAPEWRAYEDQITEYVRAEFTQRLDDFFKLEKNALYPGRSGVSHEVDLAVEFTIGGLRYVTIFEIKYRRAPLGTQEILEFSARCKDIGADKGVVFCSAGFSASAARLAKDQGISLLHTNRNTEASELTTANACVYVEARPKGRPEGSAIQAYVVEDHAGEVLGTFKTQKEAIDWAKANGHPPLVARVRHLNDKKIPDHWRSA